MHFVLQPEASTIRAARKQVSVKVPTIPSSASEQERLSESLLHRNAFGQMLPSKFPTGTVALIVVGHAKALSEHAEVLSEATPYAQVIFIVPPKFGLTSLHG